MKFNKNYTMCSNIIKKTAFLYLRQTSDLIGYQDPFRPVLYPISIEIATNFYVHTRRKGYMIQMVCK